MAKRHGLGDLVVVNRMVGAPAGRKLFESQGTSRGDVLDDVLGGKGKLPSWCADHWDGGDEEDGDMDMEDDEGSVAEGAMPRVVAGGWCDGRCSERIDALEVTLKNVE